jgi:hypothetical protein
MSPGIYECALVSRKAKALVILATLPEKRLLVRDRMAMNLARRGSLPGGRFSWKQSQLKVPGGARERTGPHKQPAHGAGGAHWICCHGHRCSVSRAKRRPPCIAEAERIPRGWRGPPTSLKWEGGEVVARCSAPSECPLGPPPPKPRTYS